MHSILTCYSPNIFFSRCHSFVTETNRIAKLCSGDHAHGKPSAGEGELQTLRPARKRTACLPPFSTTLEKQETSSALAALEEQTQKAPSVRRGRTQMPLLQGTIYLVGRVGMNLARPRVKKQYRNSPGLFTHTWGTFWAQWWPHIIKAGVRLTR